MTSPPPLTGRLTPPEFGYFADAVARFVIAAESLLKAELSHPFNIGSEAMRDRAASDDHPGTRSKQTLLTLATQQGAVGLEQCDLLRGIAALLRTDLVTLAPFPLAYVGRHRGEGMVCPHCGVQRGTAAAVLERGAGGAARATVSSER